VFASGRQTSLWTTGCFTCWHVRCLTCFPAWQTNFHGDAGARLLRLSRCCFSSSFSRLFYPWFFSCYFCFSVGHWAKIHARVLCCAVLEILENFDLKFVWLWLISAGLDWLRFTRGRTVAGVREGFRFLTWKSLLLERGRGPRVAALPLLECSSQTSTKGNWKTSIFYSNSENDSFLRTL
jgi:hypothetical protein